MLQSENGWAHVTSMLRAQKTMTASGGIGEEASQQWLLGHLTAASSIVRGRIWDFGPLLQEECVDLIECSSQCINIAINIHMKWRSFPRQPKCPEALGLHDSVTYSTKDIHVRPLIASLNCGLWQLHLLVFLNDWPRPVSPPKTRTDSRNAPNCQISQSSQILPITISI